MHLLPTEIKALSPLLKTHRFEQLALALENPGYRTHVEGTRIFHVPSKPLARAHKAVNALMRLHLPPPQGMHSMLPVLEDALQSSAFTTVLRSDIRRCFDSLSAKAALPIFTQWVYHQDFSQPAQEFLLAAGPTLFPRGGLSTGSPASPSFLDCLFTTIHLEIPDTRCWRYADDLCGLAPNPEVAHNLLQHWRSRLAPFGWQLSSEKTVICPHTQPFQFLGQTFNDTSEETLPDFILDPNSLYPFKAFTLPLHLRYHPKADSYQRTKTFIAYSAFSLPEHFQKGSIEALILGWGLSMQGNSTLYTNLKAALSEAQLYPTHATLWKSYTRNVKGPRDKGEPPKLREAERILLGLALHTYIAAFGSFPDHPRQMEQKLHELIQQHPKAKKLAFDLPAAIGEAASGDGIYHSSIKALFKVEWQLREGKQHQLPKTSPLQEVLVEHDEPQHPLLTTLLQEAELAVAP